ncbi:hypothetical protein MELA_00141 [Candidatus Methylomirabilis lanthanidiphila]|uniref:Uncharacterized protein n=1 Tax=Candidatus Methylomirabilis lanthanidiphila TaxID=2211376 RepID=A0A564ZF50_9BACT|nr:hypothetical protein [Candidatus Methylomirabilis lanthanidiphila]VUZ83783.1 hypothetical protein MELA_00141 [Candidatus Methylomirabilis lanthanidiphila]
MRTVWLRLLIKIPGPSVGAQGGEGVGRQRLAAGDRAVGLYMLRRRIPGITVDTAGWLRQNFRASRATFPLT